MLMPTIPDMNPAIKINRADVINRITASITMEELAIREYLERGGRKAPIPSRNIGGKQSRRNNDLCVETDDKGDDKNG